MKKHRKYIPLIISIGSFMTLFILFNIGNKPPEIEPQLSPRHSSYFDEFGKPSKYSSSYSSQKGDVMNVRINDRDGVSEPKISANPTQPGTFAVVANDYSSEGYASLFVTRDGGSGWDRLQIPLTIIPGNDIYYSDSWADYDSRGNLAFVTVAMRNSTYNRHIVFNISRDNGYSWLDFPVTLSSLDTKDIIFDKPKVNFDKDNNIYVTWMEESSEGAKVSLCVSKNGGKSFGPVITIAEGEIDFANILFDGDNTYLLISGDDVIKLSVSDNKGNSWSNAVVIAEFNSYGKVLDNQYIIKADDDRGVRVNSDPQAVISNGRLFLTFAAESANENNSDIYTVIGDLNKMEFSEPKTIDGNSQGDKFLPSLSVDQNGYIHILYYTSQNDPGNLMTEAYVASTNNLGYTYTYTNLSTESFNPYDIVVEGSYMGDFISIAANQGKLVAVWTDGRTGNLDLMAGVTSFQF